MNIPSLGGMPFKVSPWAVRRVFVPVPPKNRRDARKRVVIAQRRKRAGKSAPEYTRSYDEPCAYLLNNNLWLVHPKIMERLAR